MVTARTEVAPPLSPEALCERDEDRLVRLRANPTNEEASRFASELSCEKLRPQLSRLMESLGFAIPAPPPRPANSPPAAQAAVAERKPATDCASEQAALDHPAGGAFHRRGPGVLARPPMRAAAPPGAHAHGEPRYRRRGAEPASCAGGCVRRAARRQTTPARSWRRAIASRRTRPPATEKSRNSTAFAPIPTGETRSASLGQ